MIVDTDHLPDWVMWVLIGGGVLVFILVIWAIEYIIGCLTCEPCRKCYKRICQIIYVLCCCCLCHHKKNNEIEYAVIDERNPI